MKICIMGTPVRCRNRGVEALGASLVNLCLEADPKADITLLLANRDNLPVSIRVGNTRRDIPVVHARLSPWTHPRHFLPVILFMSLLHRLVPSRAAKRAIEDRIPWIKAVADADLVGDVHGGDGFSDIYGWRRFFESFLPVWTVILIRGTIAQFPQTYGPFRKALTRRIAQYVLGHSRVIAVRDRASREVVTDLLGTESGVVLSPDVAFALNTATPGSIQFEGVVPNPEASPVRTDPPDTGPAEVSPRCPIGLNVNGLMYFGGYTRDNMFGLKLDYPRFLPDVVSALLREHPGDVWMIPHTYGGDGDVESDNEAARRVRDQLPRSDQARVRLVTGEYDCHELKSLIGECQFFIGSRMHACIAALSKGVPCVGIAYSMKFRGVFETVGMQDSVVDARTTTNSEALAHIVGLYRQRQGVRQGLWCRSESARAELRAQFNLLLEAGCSTSRLRFVR